MIEPLINLILDNHNELRNKIALGKQNGFAPAERMVQTVWSKELALLAQLNSRRCYYAHDSCHDTRNIVRL